LFSLSPSPYSPPVKGGEIFVLEIPMIITERFIIRKCKNLKEGL